MVKKERFMYIFVLVCLLGLVKKIWKRKRNDGKKKKMVFF